MKMNPLETMTMNVRAMSGRIERVTFYGNPAGVAVRKWCKTCREYMPGVTKGNCRVGRDVGDGRRACPEYGMHHCYMILNTSDAKTGRVKSPQYLSFVADNMNMLSAEYANQPMLVREGISFVDFMRKRYKLITGLGVYDTGANAGSDSGSDSDTNSD